MEKPIKIEEVAPLSEGHVRALELRHKVLREPLGLSFPPDQAETETEYIHMVVTGAGSNGAIGCLILVRLEGGEMKMRQVAVAPEWQRRGIGSDLVAASERVAQREGFDRMVLHARETAVAFYLAQGYVVEGGPFDEVGLPHRKMVKAL